MLDQQQAEDYLSNIKSIIEERGLAGNDNLCIPLFSAFLSDIAVSHIPYLKFCKKQRKVEEAKTNQIT